MPQNLCQKCFWKKWFKFCAKNIFERNGSKFVPKITLKLMAQNLCQKYFRHKWLKICATNIFEINGSKFVAKLDWTLEITSSSSSYHKTNICSSYKLTKNIFERYGSKFVPKITLKAMAQSSCHEKERRYFRNPFNIAKRHIFQFFSQWMNFLSWLLDFWSLIETFTKLFA